MKDPKSAAVINMRLKYNWIVQVYGLLCLVIQLVLMGKWEYFLLFCGVFFLVQVFGVSLYRELQNGGDGMHWIADQTLNQQSGVESILWRMIVEIVILVGISLYFLIKAIGNSLI